MDRKAFKFYKSYYDVALELPDKDKLDFLMALLEVQFTGHHRQLKGMAKFAYISQKHSIDAQIEGYLTKTGATIPPIEGAYIQEKEKEKEKEKEEVQVKEKLPFDSDSFSEAWSNWIEHRAQLKKKLTPKTKEMQLLTLGAKSEQEAIDMINQSIGNGWTGLFDLKTQNNGKSHNFSADKLAGLIEAKYGNS